MKYWILSLIIFALFACQQPTTEAPAATAETSTPALVEQPEFQRFLDSSGLFGTILVFDTTTHSYFSNDFERTRKAFLPASTFKIPNSIIGLETGVITGEDHVFRWDGKPKMLKTWEADLALPQALQLSCVPCYQEVARKIGTKNMNDYLKKLNYSSLTVQDSMLDKFWLEGDFRVTPMQQMDFLKRFFFKKLPISEKTDAIMRRILVVEERASYKFSGKTGWAIREEENVGWFVGYLEKGGKTHFVVTNVQPKTETDLKTFPKNRVKVSLQALRFIAR